MKFEHIISVCEQETKHITNLDDMNVFTPFIELKLSGIPKAWSDEQVEDAFEDETKAVPIGTIYGYFVLGAEIFDNGDYTILEYCDEVSSDLENTASALMEDKGPLDCCGNMFYITQFDFEDFLDTEDINELFKQLPSIIFCHMHTTPDIIAVYPDPVQHEKSKIEQVQEDIAMMAFKDTVDTYMENIINNNEEESDEPDYNDDSCYEEFEDDDIRLSLSSEQLNIVMGRRNYRDSYDRKYINSSKWVPLLNAGFKEWKNTRVLYKLTRSDS